MAALQEHPGETGGYIQPEDLKVGVLYLGEGGNLGRIAIHRGVDELGRICFEGYEKYGDNLQLRQEVCDDREASRDVFEPTKEVSQVPEISGAVLVDWLVKQDLAIAQDRLRELECTPKNKRSPFFKDDLKDAENLVKLLTHLPSY